jgi:hypothetical protein
LGGIIFSRHSPHQRIFVGIILWYLTVFSFISHKEFRSLSQFLISLIHSLTLSLSVDVVHTLVHTLVHAIIGGIDIVDDDDVVVVVVSVVM